MSAAALTILRTPALWMAKRLRPGQKPEAYSRARHFNVETVAVAGLDELRRLLERLQDDPHATVIRGALIDPARTKHVRRLLYPDRKSGDPAIFWECPRDWVALDIEGIVRPAELPAADLVGCARLALERLPEAFRGARCIVQASAQHGIKSDIRLRLWFWLSRPTSGPELKRWLAGTPADPAVFTAVGPIYTARPIFLDGMMDPVAVRLTELPGQVYVPVPSAEELAPPPPPPKPERASGQRSSRSEPADAALIAAAMAAIPNGDVHYDDFVRWGYAIHAAGAGYEVFRQWSARSNKHDEDETRATWDRILRTGASRIASARSSTRPSATAGSSRAPSGRPCAQRSRPTIQRQPKAVTRPRRGRMPPCSPT
jgi:hypothetical protein